MWSCMNSVTCWNITIQQHTGVMWRVSFQTSIRTGSGWRWMEWDYLFRKIPSFRQTQLILLCSFNQLLVYMLPQINGGFFPLPSSLCCIPTHCCPPLSFMFLISSPSPQSPHQFPSTPCWLQCEECSQTSSGAGVPGSEELRVSLHIWLSCPSSFPFGFVGGLFLTDCFMYIYMSKENLGWKEEILPDTK